MVIDVLRPEPRATSASDTLDRTSGKNTSGARMMLKNWSEEKMIATSKLCAVAVYVTNAIVAASTGTEKAAAMLREGRRCQNGLRAGWTL